MGRILYMKNKMSGSGMKTQMYVGRGVGDVIIGRTLTPFQGGNGIFGTTTHGVVPFLGEGVQPKDKKISQRVKKML